MSGGESYNSWVSERGQNTSSRSSESWRFQESELEAVPVAWDGFEMATLQTSVLSPKFAQTSTVSNNNILMYLLFTVELFSTI